jgi:hypothetical protein
MTKDILVTALKRGPKAVERAQAKLDALAEKERMADSRARRLAIARDVLNKQKQEQAERDRVARADEAERALRESGEPFCLVSYGGQHYFFDLSRTEAVEAGTAAEGVRRLIQIVRNNWRSQVLVSRHAGSPQPAEPIAAAMSSESGLYHASRLGLFVVKSAEEPVAEPIASVAESLEHVEIEK